MIARASMLILLGWALCFASPVSAKDMRFPASGDPAVSFRMPDNWTSEIDAEGNLLLSSADHVSAFSLTFAVESGSLDDIANAALGIAKADETRVRTPAAISGFSGVSYTTTMKNATGVKLRVKMVIVRIDKTHVASFTKIEADNSSAEHRRVAETVMQSMKLSPAPAQSNDQLRNWCYGDATDDQTIQGCDAVIKSGKQSSVDQANAFDNRGMAYAHKGQFDRAIQDYDQVIKLKPDDANAFNRRCWARATMSQELEAALADCNEALRLSPNEAYILDSRGFTYLKLKLNSAAISDYDAALKIRPDAAGSLFGRGVARHRTGDKAGGDADIAAAKKIRNNIADDFVKWGVTEN